MKVHVRICSTLVLFLRLENCVILRIACTKSTESDAYIGKAACHKYTDALQAIYLDIYEGGMTWSSLDYGQFPLRNCLFMLLVDFVLYGLLAVYCDNVIPSE